MATPQEITEFKNEISTCLAYNMPGLVSKPEWGAINFEVSKEDFDRLGSLLNGFSLLPLEHLPQGILPTFTANLKPISATLGQISKFNIETDDPKGTRTAYASQLSEQVKTFFLSSHIYIPYLAYQRGDVDRNIKQLNDAVKLAEQTAQQAESEIIKRRDEIDKIVTSAREAAAKAGVAHFRDDFAAEAGTQEQAAGDWLMRTTSLAKLTLGAAVVLSGLGIFVSYPSDRIIQFVASKVLIVLILGTATLWCGRMYKSAKHLATMNRHRANALLTFQAFIQATEDEATRNAVLLETTRSIFAITSSGLIDGQEGGGSDGGGLKVLEIIKHLGGPK